MGKMSLVKYIFEAESERLLTVGGKKRVACAALMLR